MPEYDVIVVGGGVAGIAAAVASSRNGAKTLLMEKSCMLGGLATAGLISWYEPLCDGEGKQMIYGIAEELVKLSIKYGFENLPAKWGGQGINPIHYDRYATRFSPGIFALALIEYLEENGVALRFDTLATYPDVEDGICKGILVETVGGRSEDVGGVYGNTLHGHVIRGLSEKDPHKMLYRDIFLDTAELAGIVMDLDFIDETKVYAMGGSQGGALTLACASLEPRIAKAAPAEPFLCDFKRVWDMDLDVNVYGELRDYFRMFDPRHEREEEIFTKLGYIDIQYLVPRIKGEVLMLTGLLDDICPPSTQFAAYNKMTCKKRHLIYPDYKHEALKDVNDITYQFLVNE